MTQVTLVVVHGDGVYALTAHWRNIKGLLEKIPRGMRVQEGAGYVVLDLNKKLVFNAQQEFAFVQLKGFEVVQL